MTATTTTLLEGKGLVKAFGGLRAVDGVDIVVEPGTVTAVIGPNGAGKTTLFNLLSGVIPPTEGSLHFDGREITGLPVHTIARMGVARTFQNLELFEETSVLDTVLVGRYRHSTNGMLSSALRLPAARRQEAADRHVVFDLLDRFSLTDYQDRDAADLSYGLQRRVELARAVATEPRLLLLDEPMAGLTGHEAETVAQQMRDLAAEGITVLVVEHHVEAVLSVADRVIVLDQGRVISEGSPEVVRNDAAVIEAYLGVPDA